MYPNQRIPAVYPLSPYNHPAKREVAFRTPLLDINWFDTWPTIKTILLGSIMLVSSAAIIGLDIANLAIEGDKQNGMSRFGIGPAKVGAGIWSGSISFLAAIFILAIIFTQNKRIAATFALIAVTLAFFFIIALIGLSANSIQIDQYVGNGQNLSRIQYNLIIAILAVALFIFTHCIIFFIIYTYVFFSSWTSSSTKY